MGSDGKGLEMMYQRGQYEDCLNLAEKQGTNILNDFLERYTRMLLQNGEYRKAAKALEKYQCPPNNNLFPIYKTLALEILAADKNEELVDLKAMLERLCDSLALSIDKNDPIYKEFYDNLFITHILVMKNITAQNPNLGRIYTKQCTSLLRYTKIIRADKAFLDAGHANKNEGIHNMAFVLYNRYLDLAEAIDCPSNATLDNTEFENTDIPSPYDIPLPESNITTEDEREDIRDWVL